MKLPTLTCPTVSSLAHAALEALLTQALVTLTHEPMWERKGFPLPTKRMPANPDGTVTQTYRPLALLEYVDENLRDEAARLKASCETRL